MAKKGKEVKKSRDKKSKIDISKLMLGNKNEREKGEKAEGEEIEGLVEEKKGEDDLESNLDNIFSFSEGGMNQRLGSGVFGEGINPVRNLEQDIGAVGGGAEAEAGNAKKSDEKNTSYVTRTGEYTIIPTADEEERKRQRRAGDDAGRILTPKRIEFGGHETGPAARTIDVEQFQRNMMSGAAGGSEDYGDYAAYAIKREYKSNLPFEQREKRRRF